MKDSVTIFLRLHSAFRALANVINFVVPRGLAGALLLGSGLAYAGKAAVDVGTEPLFEPRFESVGVGVIPRGVVATMAQDKAGFLWIASGDGLLRYDGYRFRAQERDHAQPALRNLGWIRAMLPARDGRLWIGTETEGLAVYDPITDKVTSASPQADVINSPRHTIFALAEDHEGAIWSGMVGGGLQRFDPASGAVTTYLRSPTPGSLPDDRVQALLVDRRGDLWVGTWNGVSRRVKGSDRFETISLRAGANDADAAVHALIEASDGRIWVGTRQGGIAIINPHAAAGQMLERSGEPDKPQLAAISSFVEDQGGLMWVGRAVGIDIHRVADGQKLRHLEHDPGKASSLAANEVTRMIRDTSGAIWVAGLGLGIQRHDPGNRAIWVRGPDVSASSPMRVPDVRALLQLQSGEVLAAVHSAGVVRLDADFRVAGLIKATRLPGVGKQPGAARPDVSVMVQARDGTVWLGSDTGLVHLSQTLEPLRTVPWRAGHVRRLLIEPDGTLWIAAQDGLFRLKPGAETAEAINPTGDESLRGEVTALAIAPDQSLWVGGSQGLFRVARGSARLHRVAMAAGHELGNPVVIGMLVDRQQVLWVDTAVAGLHRLLRWDGQVATFDRISERHGIVSRPFGSNLLEDARGRIWTHMHVYDPKADTLAELKPSDGVGFGTGWFFSYTELTDRRFLFGGSKGLLVVDPARFDVYGYAPRLVLSELRINGQREKLSRVDQGLRVTPDQRSFSLEFSALDFSDPVRNRYAYRLEGFDPDWIAASAEQRVASYSNLMPGDYTLHVRGSNRSGQWSPDELAVRLQVLPAWWQTWWFKGAVVVLLAAAILLMVYVRTTQLRRRHLVLENTVRVRTAELEELTQLLEQESIALKESSLTDPMTGFHNRRFLSQRIDGDVSMVERLYDGHNQHGAPLSEGSDLVFFLVDIDHFKKVNDDHGHAAGDTVIIEFCDRMRRVFRDSDYLVRWGGEEFLVVARGTVRAHAQEVAERLRCAIADVPFLLPDGTSLHKTCSIGFACYPLAPEQARALRWDEAVHLADEALYLVKSGGRNGWMGLIQARADSEADLRQWLRKPITDWVQTGALELVESSPPVLH